MVNDLIEKAFALMLKCEIDVMFKVKVSKVILTCRKRPKPRYDTFLDPLARSTDLKKKVNKLLKKVVATN